MAKNALGDFRNMERREKSSKRAAISMKELPGIKSHSD